MKLSRGWKIFLSSSILAGLLIRLIFKEDMEWKEDEQFHFNKSQSVGVTEPWPWIGIPTGVYLPNFGMSVWVFAWLARLARITTPTGLANALAVFSVLGMCVVLVIACKLISSQREREPWLWAVALGMVNPFHVVYERKLWPQGFMPFFGGLALVGWWRRDLFWGAFLWGLFGALAGQIHMSGFFFAAGLFLWTLLFGRRLSESRPIHWKGWLAGTALGAIPIAPWLFHVLENPVSQSVSSGWNEAVQLKFWVFWITDATGLTIGNPIGLLRSSNAIGQISDFVRYPIIGGHATYFNAGVHLLLAALCLGSLGLGLKWLARNWRKSETWLGTGSQTSFAQNALLLGAGLLLTVTCVNIRRYYMVVNFPFEFLFLARLALLAPAPRARWILGGIWICQLLISAHFVGYVHVNDGAEQGDYGKAYRTLVK